MLPELHVSGISSTFVDTKGDALKRQEWSGFASTEIASEPTNSFNQPVLFKELAPIAHVVLKREVTPLPGSEQTQSDPCCGFQSKARTVLHAGPFSGRHKPHSDHSLLSEKSVSSFAQPCFTSLSQSLAWLSLASQFSLPWLRNLRWSKNRSLSHQKYVMLLTREEPLKFFLLGLPFPPQPLHLFPTSRSRVNQCRGGYSAKATNGTFNSGFLQNFPAGNKSQQNIAFAMWGLSR